MKDGFIATNGWLVKFMRRNNLSLRRRTAVAQKDPSYLIGKFVGYTMHMRRLTMKEKFPPSCIIAMDEIAVWADMVGNTTVNATWSKDIPLQSTGSGKVRVTACLTAKADGRKMEPFVIFHDAKRETTVLNEEFKHRCVLLFII